MKSEILLKACSICLQIPFFTSAQLLISITFYFFSGQSSGLHFFLFWLLRRTCLLLSSTKTLNHLVSNGSKTILLHNLTPYYYVYSSKTSTSKTFKTLYVLFEHIINNTHFLLFSPLRYQ
jgi:hypothetical protein